MRIADPRVIPHDPGARRLGFHCNVVASVSSAPRIHTATRTKEINGVCEAQASTSTPASPAHPPGPAARAVAAAAATPEHVESPVSDSDPSHAALKHKAAPQPPLAYVQPDWGGVPTESFRLEVRLLCPTTCTHVPASGRAIHAVHVLAS
jgi:hypothetical protein